MKDKMLDTTYFDTWSMRERQLSGMTYAEYLISPHWAQVKIKARKRLNYRKCEFCDSTKTELHHTSYKWILTKHELRTIISLCRDHHQEIHDLAKADQVSVRFAKI